MICRSLKLNLTRRKGVRAEAGAMMYMVDGIEMQTSTGGGLFRGFKRMITGEGLFITTFLYNGEEKRCYKNFYLLKREKER